MKLCHSSLNEVVTWTVFNIVLSPINILHLVLKFLLQIPLQHGDVDLHPHHIVEAYVRTCARFGNMVEVRVGFRYKTSMINNRYLKSLKFLLQSLQVIYFDC